MANIKTAISIPQTLFERVEALAHEMHISRSRLFALAVEDFMHRYENQRLLERINAAYTDAPEPDEQALLRRMRRQHRQMVEGEWPFSRATSCDKQIE
jgi:metal-responsive CopG/Arc/MetJ family transcriptional regulator